MAYETRVRATNSFGPGKWKDSIEHVTSHMKSPDPVTNACISKDATGVSWKLPALDGGSPIIAVSIEWRIRGWRISGDDTMLSSEDAAWNCIEHKDLGS